MKQKTLNLNEMLREIERFKPMTPPDPLDLFFRPARIFGMEIIEARVQMVPKIQLSENYGGTEEFKQRFNTWLADMFGYREVCPVPPGMAYVFGSNVLMRPESIVRIQNCSA